MQRAPIHVYMPCQNQLGQPCAHHVPATHGTMCCPCTTTQQVPERRACPNRGEVDVNKHDAKFSESVLRTSGLLFRSLCPTAKIVR